MKIALPTVFVKPVFKADRSVRLEFETRELNGHEAALLMDQRQTEGWLLYSSNNDLTGADIPPEKADPMISTKTQAQRLRGVLFKLWEQNRSASSFEDYYKTQTELIIEKLKEKLE